MSRDRRKEQNRLMKEWSRFYYDDRDLLIFILHQNGFTLEEIGELLDMKRQRVHVLVNKTRKRIENGELNLAEKFIKGGKQN